MLLVVDKRSNREAGNRTSTRDSEEPALFGSAELLHRCIPRNQSQDEAFIAKSLVGTFLASGILA